jgi:transcription elongation factor Elf1
MCDYCQPRTVLLHRGGRTFTCAYCARTQEHPYFVYDYAREGHDYCGVCGKWMEIENYVPFKTEEESIAASRGVRGVKTK